MLHGTPKREEGAESLTEGPPQESAQEDKGTPEAEGRAADLAEGREEARSEEARREAREGPREEGSREEGSPEARGKARGPRTGPGPRAEDRDPAAGAGLAGTPGPAAGAVPGSAPVRMALGPSA